MLVAPFYLTKKRCAGKVVRSVALMCLADFGLLQREYEVTIGYKKTGCLQASVARLAQYDRRTYGHALDAYGDDCHWCAFHSDSRHHGDSHSASAYEHDDLRLFAGGCELVDAGAASRAQLASKLCECR